MHCQIAGIQSPAHIDIDNRKIWLGRDPRIGFFSIIVSVTRYAGVYKDKVQAPTAIEDLIKHGGQVVIVPHVGLIEGSTREGSSCFCAFLLVTAKYVDLPEASLAQSLRDRETDSTG